MIFAMDLAVFCDSLSEMGPSCGPFHLEITELSCNPPLYGFSPPPTLRPYISACGVDKKLSKIVGNLTSYALWSR